MGHFQVARLVFLSFWMTWSMIPGDCHPRSKRSGDSMYIILNSSIPCEQLELQAPELKTVALSDEDKMDLFQLQGGVFIPNYMARTKEEGKRQFRSLLDMPPKFRSLVTLHKAVERMRTETITKEDITSYLRDRWYQKDDAHTPNDNRPERLSGATEDSHRWHHRRRNRDVNEEVSDDAGSEEMFPFALPSELGMASSYELQSGGETEVQYCLESGSVADIERNTRTLCTMCVATTTYGADKWPPTFNEALCSPEDMDCLVLEGIGVPQGVCRQNTMDIQTLCKREGFCSLALQNGETVIVEEWDICYQNLRVGCECTLYATSFLGGFL